MNYLHSLAMRLVVPGIYLVLSASAFAQTAIELKPGGDQAVYRADIATLQAATSTRPVKVRLAKAPVNGVPRTVEFTVVGKAGTGAFQTVFEVLDAVGRRLALKVPKPPGRPSFLPWASEVKQALEYFDNAAAQLRESESFLNRNGASNHSLKIVEYVPGTYVTVDFLPNGNLADLFENFDLSNSAHVTSMNSLQNLGVRLAEYANVTDVHKGNIMRDANHGVRISDAGNPTHDGRKLTVQKATHVRDHTLVEHLTHVHQGDLTQAQYENELALKVRNLATAKRLAAANEAVRVQRRALQLPEHNPRPGRPGFPSGPNVPALTPSSSSPRAPSCGAKLSSGAGTLTGALSVIAIPIEVIEEANTMNGASPYSGEQSDRPGVNCAKFHAGEIRCQREISPILDLFYDSTGHCQWIQNVYTNGRIGGVNGVPTPACTLEFYTFAIYLKDAQAVAFMKQIEKHGSNMSATSRAQAKSVIESAFPTAFRNSGQESGLLIYPPGTLQM